MTTADLKSCVRSCLPDVEAALNHAVCSGAKPPLAGLISDGTCGSPRMVGVVPATVLLGDLSAALEDSDPDSEMWLERLRTPDPDRLVIAVLIDGGLRFAGYDLRHEVVKHG